MINIRLSIFKKANELINLVKIDGEIRNKIYLSVEHKSECPDCYGEGKIGETEECITCDGTGQINNPVKVCLACDGKKTYVESCTCTMHSIHQGTAERLENKLILCSYVLSCLVYLTKNGK